MYREPGERHTLDCKSVVALVNTKLLWVSCWFIYDTDSVSCLMSDDSLARDASHL